MNEQYQTLPGKPLPFGVSIDRLGHNFAVFSKKAKEVVLQIYENQFERTGQRFVLDPRHNRTGDVWHILIKNLPTRFYYSYSVDGPHFLPSGDVFNKDLELIDPYAKAISGLERWQVRDSGNRKLGCFEEIEYDWGDDRPLNIALAQTIIYELHVRGFTKDPSSKTKCAGTYQGIVEKIEYLKELGITAVEILPVHEFDEKDCKFVNPVTGKKLVNYWGYSSINFFALKSAYAVQGRNYGAGVEFRDMVKTLHKEGIEVILDVVFNHTAEGDKDGSVLNFKGFGNSTYYILDEKGDYKNYSGCGNTMNCNHPVVRKMIMDSLRYFLIEMHVDGFRFDLASILSRDENGNVLPNPPLLELIAKDPVLSKTKIIAEAWDAAGLYQVGSFPASKRWAEWNGKYRDLIRRFCKGEPGLTGEVATRISGSEDLYKHSERNPYHSINFITAHDGYTMMDLVSYAEKHNIENGEDNNDGCNYNFSMNFGFEGKTSEKSINAKRKKQIRNMATILMLSQGTPMILAGDEFGNSQNGNNNAWCQDNSTSWLDWSLLRENQDLFLFWKKLIQFRKNNPGIRRRSFFSGIKNTFSGIQDISWHNTVAYQPDFDSDSTSLAFLIDGMEGDVVIGKTIYVAMNFSDSKLEFEIPTVYSDKRWMKMLSTENPENFIAENLEVLPSEVTHLSVESFSISLLVREY
ncbi:glycogen debranching protein GlgX [bacterium]|nr:glycogen debranching protein GlgX [bacterium]